MSNVNTCFVEGAAYILERAPYIWYMAPSSGCSCSKTLQSLITCYRRVFSCKMFSFTSYFFCWTLNDLSVKYGKCNFNELNDAVNLCLNPQYQRVLLQRLMDISFPVCSIFHLLQTTAFFLPHPFPSPPPPYIHNNTPFSDQISLPSNELLSGPGGGNKARGFRSNYSARVYVSRPPHVCFRVSVVSL